MCSHTTKQGKTVLFVSFGRAGWGRVFLRVKAEVERTANHGRFIRACCSKCFVVNFTSKMGSLAPA